MSREERPSMPWYMKDWFASEDRARMTYEARGVYRELLDYSWLHRGIPNNLQTMSNWLGLQLRRFQVLWVMIAPCWYEEGDRLFNRKQEKVRAELDEYKAARSAAGKQGGRPKKESSEKAQVKQTESKPEAKQKPAFASAIAFADPKEETDPTSTTPSVAIQPQSTTTTPRHFDRTHAGHIHGFCEFKCFSEEKAQLFAKDLPGGQADPKNFDRVREWAEDLRDTWGEQPKLEFEWFKFWEARWKERNGSPTHGPAALARLVARVQERLSHGHD